MAHTKVTKTYSQNTGTANTFSYSGSFDVFKATEVEVELDNVALTYTASTINESASPREYTVDVSAKTIHIGGADLSSGTIVIEPVTDMGAPTPRATYTPGASITAADLNNNQKQLMRKAMEYDEQKLSSRGGTMTGHLTMGEDQTIIFEGATDNAHEITVTVADPSSDTTITLPNTTGTVVTTGDTATVTATMLAADSVDSSELVDGSIDTSHIGNLQVTTGKLAGDAVDGTKLADNAVDSEHYTDGSIDTAHIADSQVTTAKIADANITTAKITDGNVTTAKIAADAITAAKIADDVVNSEHIAAGAVDLEHMSANSVDSDQYVDGSIDTAHLADNAVTNDKIASSPLIAGNKISPDFGSSNIATTGTLAARNTTITGTLSVSGDFDCAAGSIDTAEIAADAITGAKIADDAVDSEHLAADSIDAEHYAAGSVDTTALGADAVTAAKIADDVVNSEHYAAASIDTEHIADGQVTAVKVASNAVTTAKITDSNVTTAKIADSNVTLAKLASDLKSTSISDSDTQLPTSGAVVDYVAAQIAPIGGLEVIATDAAFPNTQPAAGVVISIADAGGLVVNGSGTSTTGRTVGSSTVTINNIASNFNSSTVDAGVCFQVSSTGSGHIYNYHKATLKEADLLNLSNDINDFAARYRVNAGEPGSNNDAGDLVFDTNASKMKVYDGSSWGEVTSSGDFKYLVMTNAGTTNAATLNGSTVTFDLKETSTSGSAASITSAAQLMVSVNGVIQKPNTGTSASGLDGFVMADSDTITFCAAPASGDDIFIIQTGSAITPTTPADGTVSAAKIASGAVTTVKIADANVTTAKLASDAVTGAKIADDAVGAEHIENLDATVTWVDSAIAAFGTDGDQAIWHTGSTGYIRNSTGGFVIRNDNFSVKDDGESETLLTAVKDGAVSLYYDNVKKFETTSGGAKVTGELQMGGTAGVKFSHSGTSSIYESQTAGDELLFKTTPSGGSSTTRLTVSPTGALTVAGSLEVNGGDVDFDNHLVLSTDTKAIKFGAGNDLQIYHDGTQSIIETNSSATKPLHIKGDPIWFYKTGTSELFCKMVADQGVELYHNDVLKARTVSDGFEIQSNVEGGEALCTFVADQADDNNDYWAAGAGDGKFTIKTYATGSWVENFRIEAGSNARFLAPDGGLRYFFGEMGNSDSAELSLYNSGDTQKVRISAHASNASFLNGGGDLIIGGNTLAANGSLSISPDHDDGAAMILFNRANTSNTSDAIVFQNNTGNKGYIQYDDSEVTYYSASDYRLKENDVVISDGITKVKQLRPIRFNWKGHSDTVEGFFAHEVQSVVPNAVDGVKDAVDDDGNIVSQMLEQSKLVPLLTAALKEAITKIETLETKVAALEAG